MMGVGQASLALLTYWQLSLPGTMFWLPDRPIVLGIGPPQRLSSQYVIASAPQLLARLVPVQAAYVSWQYQIAESLMPLSCTLHRLPHDLGRRHAPGSPLMGPLFLFILRRLF